MTLFLLLDSFVFGRIDIKACNDAYKVRVLLRRKFYTCEC